MDKKRVIMKVSSVEEMSSCVLLLTALYDESEVINMEVNVAEAYFETEQYEIIITCGQENTVTVIGDVFVDLINEKF